jgi:two-component system chemotaxis sensor kinase CheA
MNGLDPEILQDFLTESGELLGQLESDLVVLESTPEDPDLINKVFRALHTIKGSSSFLDLTNLVRVAHAAESALNAARNKQAVVDKPMMDLLLQVVDLLKIQMDQVRAGEALTVPDDTLVETLKLIGDGKQSTLAGGLAPIGGGAVASVPEAANAGQANVVDDEWMQVRPLTLGPGKAELAEFMVADTVESVGKIGGLLGQLADPATRATAAGELVDLCDALARSVEFFDCDSMAKLVRTLGEAADAHRRAGFAPTPSLWARLGAVSMLLDEQTNGLVAGSVISRKIDALVSHIATAARGEADPAGELPAGASSADALVHDSVMPEGGAESAQAPAAPIVSPVADVVVDDAPSPVLAVAAKCGEEAKKPEEAKKVDETKKANQAVAGDQTIRVEVGRLEALMNLVGELVLQKNRLQALIRTANAQVQMPGELKEQLGAAGGGLDRVTSDMQVAVLRTRMQPLDKLFGKYPRLIRDLATKTGKQIDLVIEGGETEVDKSVIEELGDPLVHLMRNAADHGLEPPEERLKTGKSAGGTIRLIASNEGGHVSVLVVDDGRGLTRERIGKKAVERGLVTPEALAQMPDNEVFRFIFLPGFSTADQVSDLSGRGVGMDVVRNNIEKLKGTIDLSSQPGKGTTVAITIPLTVAIMPAMMVGVGREIYAIPLNSIVEIVRPETSQMLSIGEHPVLRLRDDVLPLISAAEVFHLRDHHLVATPFAVILSLNGRRLGLMVARLIGQQEVVIKSLESLGRSSGGRARGPIAGATVRDDGNVSLIVDVAELMRLAESSRVKKAA